MLNTRVRFYIFFYLLFPLILFPQQHIFGQEHFNYTAFLESIRDVPQDSLGYYLYNTSIRFAAADSLNAASELLKHCKEIAENQHDNLLLTRCILQIGEVSNNLLEYNNSFEAYTQALESSVRLKDTGLMIDAMNGIERYYYQLEMIDSAIVMCLRELELNKIRKDYTKLADNYRALYSYQRYTTGPILLEGFVLDGLIDSSLSAARKSKDPEVYCHALTNFGLTIFNKDKELAYQYMHMAIDSARKLPSPSRALVYALTKASIIYLQDNKMDDVRSLLTEALPLAKETAYYNQLTHIYSLSGALYLSDDSVNKAIEFYNKAIVLAEKYRCRYYLPGIYYALFNIYQTIEDVDSIYKFQRKYMEIFRKKHDHDMNLQIARLSAKYQIEQKTEAIDNLTIINNQRKVIIRNQRRFIIVLVVAILITAFLFTLLYYQFRKVKRAHNKLSLNALEINRKNREIIELKEKRNQQLQVVHGELKTKLEELFEKKEVYQRKDLTLAKTATMLKTNTSYISALINQDYQCKFNQFVNKYRIQKACELLSDRDMDKYSIEGIADLSGFKSKSVFNQAFKEATGVNPSTFRKATGQH